MSRDGQVVDLLGRPGFRVDLAGLAGQQVAAARDRLDATPEQFATMLAPVLGWTPSFGNVEAWESGTIPPGDVLLAASLLTKNSARALDDPSDVVSSMLGGRYADLTAVYPSRADFLAKSPAPSLFDNAKDIRLLGLSLNMLCQSYPIPSLQHLLLDGTTIRCLFLDPNGEIIREREREEGCQPGHLQALTAVNISVLLNRVRPELPEDAAGRLQARVYDQPIRLNLIIIDSVLCVMQPYLPEARGGDSPTFVIQRKANSAGLFGTFDQVFDTMWERSREP